MNNWKKLNEGVINGDWFAHYRQARTDSSFKKKTYGCEIFDGATQEQATECRFEVVDRHKSGSVKNFIDWNNGNTPDNELLLGRMLHFKPNENPVPQSISKRGLGFKKEDHRYGGWNNWKVPGENGYIIQLNFTYCSDENGKVEIDDKYDKLNMINKNRSIRYELYQTDIENKEFFPQGNGLLRDKFHFELPSKGSGISLTEMETNLKIYNSELPLSKNTTFYDEGKEQTNRKVYLPLLDKNDNPVESYKELIKLDDNMVVEDTNNNKIEFEVYYGFKLHQEHDKIGYDKLMKRTKGNILLKAPGSPKWEQPNLFILGPRDKTIGIKTGAQFWDSYTGIGNGNGKNTMD